MHVHALAHTAGRAVVFFRILEVNAGSVFATGFVTVTGGDFYFIAGGSDGGSSSNAKAQYDGL